MHQTKGVDQLDRPRRRQRRDKTLKTPPAARAFQHQRRPQPFPPAIRLYSIDSIRRLGVRVNRPAK